MRRDPASFAAVLVATPARRNALAVAAAIVGAMLLLDGPALRLFAERGPVADRWLRLATLVGDSGWMLAACGGVALAAGMAWRRTRSIRYARGLRRVGEMTLAAFACVGLLGLLAAGLKLVIGRPRPKMVDQAGLFGFEPLAFSFKMNSFPSGHSTTLFALAAVLVILAPRYGWAVLSVAALGALTRVTVGAHHVSDIVAGAALGWFGSRGLLAVLASKGIGFDGALRPRDGRTAAAALRRLIRGTANTGADGLRRLKGKIDGRIRAGTGSPLLRGGADEERGR